MPARATDRTLSRQDEALRLARVVSGLVEQVGGLAGAQEEQIRKVLAATHGNKTRAAELLGIERKTLYRKLERMRSVSS